MADFGNSYLQGSDFYTKACGVIPYVDPKIFESDSYVLTEKSDIYTVATGYTEPVCTENWLYWTETLRTDLFIVNYTGYTEFI